MSEHRSSPRIRSLLGGRIEFNHRQSTMDCLVREMSEGGAKLEVTHSVTIPDEFDLVIPSKDQHFHAVVRWRQAKFLGVEFMNLQPAVAPDYPELVRKLRDENEALRKELAELKSVRGAPAF